MADVQVTAAGGLQQPTGTAFPVAPAMSAADSPRVRPMASFDNSSQSTNASRQSLPTPLQLSASGVSTSTFPALRPDDLTPPSSATPSSNGGRDDTPTSPTPKKGAGTTIGARKLDSPGPSRSLSPARRTRTDSTAGSKRTASGQIKNTHHQSFPQDISGETGRMRASSSASVGSTGNVTEISQQLRTKLKYAMVKVQNGWQSRSLEEIETLASASPRSTVSGFPADRHLAESPRRLMQQRSTRKWSDSSSSESSRSDLHVFSSSRLPGVPEDALQQPQLRGLAPPADIISGHRRRPSPNETGGASGISKLQDLRRGVRPSSKQRTPSQNAAMEADAVETLMFMASPNNSGYHPSSQASQVSSLRPMQPLSAMTSPLRTQFSQTSVSSPKKVAFTDQHKAAAEVNTSAFIDHMLDNLPDESEDELNETLALVDGPKIPVS